MHRWSHVPLRARLATIAPALVLTLAAGGLAVVPGLTAPASAATVPVGDLTALQAALDGGCSDGDLIEVSAPITDVLAELTVACDVTLQLAGQDVAVRNVVIEPGHTLTVTDSSTTSADAGTLSVDTSTNQIFGLAGISTTGATLEVSGVAKVVASAYVNAAAIGGDSQADGGTVVTRGQSTVTATGFYGSGIGGGNGGAGGTTTTYDDSTVTATGGDGAAGIGGGTYGAGGTTTTHNRSTVVATGGSQGAGIGSGLDGRRNLGQPGGTLTTYDQSSVTAIGGLQAAGIGGGYYGYGGTTTTADSSTVTATGGFAGAGIGGGQNGDGGTTTVGGTSTVTASSLDQTSAVGAGPRGAVFGSLLVTDDATLRLPTGRLEVLDTATTPDGVEVTVTARATITGSGGPASTNATLAGAGQVANGGSITIPTADVAAGLPVLDHHYDVTFDAAGGVLAPATVSPTRVYAATFVEGARAFPADPTRSGYLFAGWNTAADGRGQTLTATTPLPGSSTDGTAVPVTAHAQWQPVPPPPSLPASDLRVDETPQVGVPLTATFTRPTVDGLVVTWTWFLDRTPIAGADQQTYTPTADQVGQVLRVAVSLSAPGYGSRTDRVPTRPVLAAPVVELPLPDPQLTVSGTPVVGQPTTATITRPDVDGLQVTWAWSVDGTPIPGADQATYTPTTAQVGRGLTVAVTLGAPGRTTRTDRATTAPVVAPAVPSLDLQVEGTPQVGLILRASSSDLVDGTSGAAWQWAVLDEGGATDVPGATAATFTPSAAQLGRRLRVTLTVTGSSATRTASTETAIVSSGVQPTPVVAVLGTVREARVLRATVRAGARPDGRRVHYEWSADGRRLPGLVHTATRTLVPSLVGKRLTVAVTLAAPGYGTVRATSTPTPRVQRTRTTYLARTPDPTARGRAFVVFGHGPVAAASYRLVLPDGKVVRGRLTAADTFEQAISTGRFCSGVRSRTGRLVVSYLRGDATVADRAVLYVRC